MARILVVDDEEIILQMLCVLLSGEKHEVIPVKDGETAIALIRSDELFDLLITDLRMSPVDGMEVLAAAKESRPSMPGIVVSAYYSEKNFQKTKALGCSIFVKKP
ncbi:MAG: response regulator, partial [Thermodesulfobacteriota bacterium]|nr:response regulator [Thermodesulfobacteriota bacterium]